MKSATPSDERLTLSFEQYGLGEVAMIGRYAYTRAHPPLLAHVHPKIFEVCLLQKGTQTYFVGDKRVELKAGDMIITRPGEVHGTGTEPENRGRLYWVEFEDPLPNRPYLGLPPGAAAMIFNSFKDLTQLQFHNCDLLIGTFERILTLDLNGVPPEFAKVSVQNLLLRLLLDILALTGRDAHLARSEAVRKALHYMAKHCDEPLSLGRLAAVAHTSVSYLKLHFPREVGMTPMEHLMWLRIEKAKRLLRETSLPITALTHQTGFVTSQHFATVFKRVTGMTPRNYRQRSGKTPTYTAPTMIGEGADFHPVNASAHR